jgi:hypothetical protein
MDMKSFLQFVVEVLSPDQRAQVDAWEGQTQQAKQMTDHFFGQNNEEMVVPFPTKTEKSQTHKDIEAAIGQEIPIEDYIAGVIRRPTGNPIRIPRRLTEPSLVKAFSEDPSRSGKKNEADALQGYTVRITRSKYGVANQTANQQPWSSCKRFGGCGPGEAYLRTEAQHGTVVSYLIDPDGNEVGRTTLQPLRNREGDHIYGVWGEYGNTHGAWRAFNQNLSRQLSSPFRKGRDPVFVMNTDHLYADGKPSTIVDPEADSGSITHVINNPPNIDSIRSLRGHRNFGQEHIDQIFDKVYATHKNHGSSTIALIDFARSLLKPQKSDASSRSWKITPEHLSKVFSMESDGDDENFTNEKLLARGLGPDYANTVYTLNYLQQSALTHPSMTPEHYKQAVQNGSGYTKSLAFKHIPYNTQDLHNIINTNTSIPYSGILQHPSLDSSHIDAILARSRWHQNALRGPASQRNPLFDHNFGEALARVHDRISPEAMDYMLRQRTTRQDGKESSPIHRFKENLLRQKQFNSQELKTLLANNESSSIRDEALRMVANPTNTSVEDIQSVLDSYEESHKKLSDDTGVIKGFISKEDSFTLQRHQDDIGAYMSNNSLRPHFKQIVSDPNLSDRKLGAIVMNIGGGTKLADLGPQIAQRPNLPKSGQTMLAVNASQALQQDNTSYDDSIVGTFDTLHKLAQRPDVHHETHQYIISAIAPKLHRVSQYGAGGQSQHLHAREIARTIVNNPDLHPDTIDQIIRSIPAVREEQMYSPGTVDLPATASKIKLWDDLLRTHGSRMSMDQLQISSDKLHNDLGRLRDHRGHILQNEGLGEDHPDYIKNEQELKPAIQNMISGISRIARGRPYDLVPSDTPQ